MPPSLLLLFLLLTITQPANSMHNNNVDDSTTTPSSNNNNTTDDDNKVVKTKTVKSAVKCQEITIPMCKTIRYNYTEMPNSFNHETQEEAGLEVHQYWPLVEIKCSSDLKFFICSLYVPICMEDYTGTVPPCRSVCERARAGCEPVMTHYGFFWPEQMACDQFPKFGKNSICMDEKGGELPGQQVLLPPKIPPPKIPKKKPTHESSNCTTTCTKCPYPLVTLTTSNKLIPIRSITNNATIHPTQHLLTNNCALPCRGYGYASPEEITFANYWLTFWSSITSALSTLTVLTFLIDSTRFNYPERPIILISFCYVFVSLGYLLRIHLTHEEVACGGPSSEIVRYPGLLISPHQHNSRPCTIVFLLTYYFTLAGSCWYVVLTATWYLASVLKWSTESISEKSPIFHTAVWLSSALLTLSALLTDSVDGDSISGICFVGNQSTTNLLTFVLLPLSTLLITGTFFLITGFVSLLRIRTVIQREVRNFHKLEKLMIRIGVFGVLYTVNVGCVLAGFVYEAWVRGEWVRGLSCGGGEEHRCDSSDDPQQSLNVAKPAYSVLMIKYFMSLATGLTASIWVFSPKTIETWKRFLTSTILSSSTTTTTNNQSLSPQQQNQQNKSNNSSSLSSGGILPGQPTIKQGGSILNNTTTLSSSSLLHHHHHHQHHHFNNKQTHV